MFGSKDHLNPAFLSTEVKLEDRKGYYHYDMFKGSALKITQFYAIKERSEK